MVITVDSNEARTGVVALLVARLEHVRAEAASKSRRRGWGSASAASVEEAVGSGVEAESPTGIGSGIGSGGGPSGDPAGGRTGDQVRIAPLRAGDFSLSGQVLIERKTTADFLLSLRDRRLFDQARRMACSTSRPIVIHEGDPAELAAALTESQLRGVTLALAVGFRVPLLNTRDLDDTVAMIVHIGMQEEKRFGRPRICLGPPPGECDVVGAGGAGESGVGESGAGGRAVSAVGDARVASGATRSTRELVEVLCSLPGVGPTRAVAIAERIGGVGDVARVGLRELMAVPGVGPGTAARIHDALRRRVGDGR